MFQCVLPFKSHFFLYVGNSKNCLRSSLLPGFRFYPPTHKILLSWFKKRFNDFFAQIPAFANSFLAFILCFLLAIQPLPISFLCVCVPFSCRCQSFLCSKKRKLGYKSVCGVCVCVCVSTVAIFGCHLFFHFLPFCLFRFRFNQFNTHTHTHTNVGERAKTAEIVSLLLLLSPFPHVFWGQLVWRGLFVFFLDVFLFVCVCVAIVNGLATITYSTLSLAKPN